MYTEKRPLLICLFAIIIGTFASFVARLLVALIGLVTNVAFYGRLSTSFVSPADHHLGLWVIVIPALGGIIVGYMARYGSKAIRGHGIPEAMEQILLNESKIPARLTFLKPLSAAIAIGTGGPFGAEGPIIATGGALGSLLGQWVQTTSSERKTLLAAGAAAGMTATFGTPLAGILLAIELLLFEFSARSIIPVALACGTACAIRNWLVGTMPCFPMPAIATASGSAIALYCVEGLLVGIAAVAVTKMVYWIEDQFDHLPIHWMWWPALGGLVVGAIGYISPKTLGVGYINIEQILSGEFAGKALFFFCAMKLLSWSVSLSSGTSGGTLAPLFTIGGGLGAAVGAMLGLDIRMAALVGMAGIFAGASRALLASAVFAYEATQRPETLLPLLAGCTCAHLISALIMKNTIMTEKIARRGTVVPHEYHAKVSVPAKVS